MALSHDAGFERPARIMSLAQLSQWKADHEREDDHRFAAIDRKLNWLIGGLAAVLLSVVGGLAHQVWTDQEQRLQALEHPAAAAPR